MLLREGDLHVESRTDVLGGREGSVDGGPVNAPTDITAKEQGAVRATLHVLRALAARAHALDSANLLSGQTVRSTRPLTGD